MQRWRRKKVHPVAVHVARASRCHSHCNSQCNSQARGEHLLGGLPIFGVKRVLQEGQVLAGGSERQGIGGLYCRLRHLQAAAY